MNSVKLCPGESCKQTLNEGEKLCPYCKSKKNQQTKKEIIYAFVTATLIMLSKHLEKKYNS
jgi:uncharacterized paraquat-inducible protein A